MILLLGVLTCCVSCGGEELDLAAEVTPLANGRDSTGAPRDKAIVYLSSGCSGTFIHPHYILTAAHCLPNCTRKGRSEGCVDAASQDDVVSGGPWRGRDGPTVGRWWPSEPWPSEPEGLWASDGDQAEHGARYQIDAAYFARPEHFRRWRLRTLPSPPDVALLHTVQPFQGTPIPVMPASTLPHPRTHCALHDDEVVTLAGFGAVPPSGLPEQQPPRRLGAAVVECDLQKDDRAFKVDARLRGALTCGADAGGPALWTTKTGQWQVGGVHSFSAGGCSVFDGESGEAFIPRPFLEERARADGCPRGWDACVRDPKSAAYLGCFREGSRRDLSGYSILSSSNMTTRRCMDTCRQRGYRYAGTQYGGQCFCGNSYGRYGRLGEASCNSVCTGDRGEFCGGRGANKVYRLYNYLGCFADDQARDLGGSYFRSARMTTDKCVSHCKNRGYRFAGTQYGGYCFCGDHYGRLGQSTECDMPCAGSSSEICGGPWANSVWTTR